MSKIAILGFGVVGSGTVELFYKNKDKILSKAGKDLNIKYILDLRDFPDSPYKEKVIHDFEVIANDNEVEIVAEVMGGSGAAYTFTKRCLELGKSVVTSNKELVAVHGAELLKLAQEHNCNYFFEASTGGAIPVIRPIHQCLAGNDITEIDGILNGTTNYILTKMIDDNMNFDDALKKAQELGYAEKNPAADVDGIDACRKICILSSLAFGKHVYPDVVKTEGISKITLEDAEYAKNWGGAIKLIASVKRFENGKIMPMVRPAVVPFENMLSNVSDVFNAVMVKADAVGEVMFYGRGAGKLPTASAGVSDIIDAAKAGSKTSSLTWQDCSNPDDCIEDFAQSKSRSYIRVIGDKAEIERVFGDVEFISRKNQPENEFAFVTGSIKEIDTDEKMARFTGKILGRVRII